MAIRAVEPVHQTAWDWRAATQFICGGTGSGLIVLTALAAWQEPAWLWRTGPVGLAFICLGLLAVFLKLGRRWRAFLVILNPFTSWLTREALLAPVLLGLGVLAVALTNQTLALVAGMVGLAFLYSQGRILKAARGIPAWRHPRMLWLIFTTGLAEGASGLAIASAVFGTPGGWFNLAFSALLVARLAAWIAYRRALSGPGATPIRTVEMLNRMNPVVLLAGHAGPLVLLLFVLFFPNLGWLFALVAGLAGLLGGWYLKYMLVAHAAYTQGFALARTPARTPGYSGPGVKPGWTTPLSQRDYSPRSEAEWGRGGG